MTIQNLPPLISVGFDQITREKKLRLSNKESEISHSLYGDPLWGRPCRTPEEHLAAIEIFADEILAKPESWGKVEANSLELWLTKGPGHIARYIKNAVTDCRKAMKTKDSEKIAQAGIDLARAFYALGKQESLDQKKQAQNTRHANNNKAKEVWLADALAELRQLVTGKAELRTGWRHTDYLDQLYKKEKYGDAKPAWKDQLKLDFKKALRAPADLNRPNLIRGIKRQ